jgi:predicted RNA binding protein YcfA (HicA-like mRNA interferase family)
MNGKELIKQLENDGWMLRGVKGIHHFLSNQLSLLKQAGLKR